MSDPHQELARLRAEVERLRREGSVAIAKVAELIGERDRLSEALEEVCMCETCSGSGVFQPECEACLSGIGTCTCRQTPNEKCPQCYGSGHYYHGSAKAQAILEAK